jgi:hypothetical protein
MTIIRDVSVCPAIFPGLNFISLSEMQGKEVSPSLVEKKEPLVGDPIERCPANFPSLNFPIEKSE